MHNYDTTKYIVLHDQLTGDPVYYNKEDCENYYFLYQRENNFLKNGTVVRRLIFQGIERELSEFLKNLKKDNLILSEGRIEFMKKNYHPLDKNIIGYYYEEDMIGYISLIHMVKPKEGIKPTPGLPPELPEP